MRVPIDIAFLYGHWQKKENRVKAIKRMVDDRGKKPTEITHRDFLENGLRGLLPYYSNSPFKALKDAGYPIEEWEMKRVPKGP